MRCTEQILVTCILIVLVRQSNQLQCAKCEGAFSTLSCHEHQPCFGPCFMSVHPSPRFNGHVYTGGCATGKQCDLPTSDSNGQQTKCCTSGNLCNLNLNFDHVVDKPSTTLAPLNLSVGLQCQVCSGPACGLYEDGQTMKCSQDYPYCLNTVLNDSEGNKLITKRCARYDECKARVLEPGCLNFDPSKIYTKVMECTFCCQTSFCNRLVVPQKETLVLLG